tara:strand:+ start:877 stop:1161 length:285 start_codon:yes stop_codon:yes gene_type:complete
MTDNLVLIISLITPFVAIAVMWGKHTESVKNQHAKNVEQDERFEKQEKRSSKQDDKIDALQGLVTEREDLLRDLVDDRFTLLDAKVDRLIEKLI